MSEPFSLLPPELTVHILNTLPVRDALNARLVCQDWNIKIMSSQAKIREFEDQLVIGIDMERISQNIYDPQNGPVLVDEMIRRLNIIERFFLQHNFALDIVVKNWGHFPPNERERENLYQVWNEILAKLTSLFRVSKNVKMYYCILANDAWIWILSQCNLKTLFLEICFHLRSPVRFWLPTQTPAVAGVATITKFTSYCSNILNISQSDVWLENVTCFAFFQTIITRFTLFRPPISNIIASRQLERLKFGWVNFNPNRDQLPLGQLFARPELKKIILLERNLEKFHRLKRAIRNVLPPGTQMTTVSELDVTFRTSGDTLTVQCIRCPAPMAVPSF